MVVDMNSGQISSYFDQAVVLTNAHGVDKLYYIGNGGSFGLNYTSQMEQQMVL